MLQANARRQRRSHIGKIDGNLPHIGRPRHFHRGHGVIDDIAAGDDHHGDAGWEDPGRKRVSETDGEQQNGLQRQDKPLSPAVDQFADELSRADADKGDDHAQDGEHLGPYAEHFDQHPGRKGHEDLVSRAADDGQDIIEPIALSENKLGFLDILVRPAFLHQPKGERGEHVENSADDKGGPIGHIHEMKTQQD